MRLISKKNLLAESTAYPDTQAPIEAWYTMLKASGWNSLEDIRKSYSSTVDEAYGYTIFNIKGNKYRLIVQINYRNQIVFFKRFMTHTEYGKINWSNQEEVKQKLG